MLACDERLGDSSGRFHIHATGLGIPYPTAVLEIVSHALGTDTGKRTLLLGTPISGSCRQREGWLHDIVGVSDLVDHAIKRASDFGALDSASFANTKSRLLAPAIERITKNKDTDARAFTERVASENTQKRIAQAVQKLEIRRKHNP